MRILFSKPHNVWAAGWVVSGTLAPIDGVMRGLRADKIAPVPAWFLACWLLGVFACISLLPWISAAIARLCFPSMRWEWPRWGDPFLDIRQPLKGLLFFGHIIVMNGVGIIVGGFGGGMQYVAVGVVTLVAGGLLCGNVKLAARRFIR